MEVELLQDIIDKAGMFVTFVGAIEGMTGGIHRRCCDFENLVFGRNGGDPRCYTETQGRQSAQLFHQDIDLHGVRPLWVKNGFGVVEDYESLLRR